MRVAGVGPAGRVGDGIRTRDIQIHNLIMNPAEKPPKLLANNRLPFSRSFAKLEQGQQNIAGSSITPGRKALPKRYPLSTLRPDME